MNCATQRARFLPTDYDAIIKAMHVLKTETLVTRVRPYATLIGTSFTKEYHDSLHSTLPEGETEYPHSIHFQAVLSDIQDLDSEVVGFIAAGVAWVSEIFETLAVGHSIAIVAHCDLDASFFPPQDASMKDLLPEGVSNIYVVVENNCNQSYTFDIDGPRANFVGTGDFHETAYDHMQVHVDLNIHTHPESANVPGHCFYWMVSCSFSKSLPCLFRYVKLFLTGLSRLPPRTSIQAKSLKRLTTHRHQRFSHL